MSIPVLALPMELKKLPVMGWMELMQVMRQDIMKDSRQVKLVALKLH